jgi:hypothetical protein
MKDYFNGEKVAEIFSPNSYKDEIIDLLQLTTFIHLNQTFDVLKEWLEIDTGSTAPGT